MVLETRTYICVLLVSFGLVACGGEKAGNPGSPSGGGGGGQGNTCASQGVLGSAKGVITATVDGVAFNGGVSTGNSIYTPIAAGPFVPAPMDFFVINGVCGDGSQLVMSIRAGSWQNGVFVLGAPGQTQIGVDATGNPRRDPQTQQPLTHMATYTLVRNGVAAGAWVTGIAGGTGSITLNNVSPTAASGSFSLTMAASAGGATGTKQVTGTFNVTF
jgi:hypothetical protein